MVLSRDSNLSNFLRAIKFEKRNWSFVKIMEGNMFKTDYRVQVLNILIE